MQTAERRLPPLATRAPPARVHKLDLAFQLAEGLRSYHYGPSRFTSSFCTHYVKMDNVVRFLCRDELKQYANDGYMNVPWNAKTLHELALDVDRMQSKLLADLKGDLDGQESFNDYVTGILEGKIES